MQETADVKLMRAEGLPPRLVSTCLGLGMRASVDHDDVHYADTTHDHGGARADAALRSGCNRAQCVACIGACTRGAGIRMLRTGACEKTCKLAVQNTAREETPRRSDADGADADGVDAV